MIFLVSIIIFSVILDQVSKYMVSNEMIGGTIIPKVLSIKYARNTGAAYSLFEGQTLFLIIFTTFAIGFIFYLYFQYKSIVTKLGLAMIIGGAIGNYIDRVYHGYVVDFIHVDFFKFPIFNVADIFVTVGSVVVAIGVIFLEKEL